MSVVTVNLVEAEPFDNVRVVFSAVILIVGVGVGVVTDESHTFFKSPLTLNTTSPVSSPVYLNATVLSVRDFSSFKAVMKRLVFELLSSPVEEY